MGSGAWAGGGRGVGMSDIRFRCPRCGSKLTVPARHALTDVECPRCHAGIRAWGSELLDIRFRCPACRHKLVVDRQAAGTEQACPACSEPVTVPGLPDAEAPPPAEPPPEAPPTPREGPAAGTLSREEMDFLTS